MNAPAKRPPPGLATATAAEANRADDAGQYRYHYSLTQRVFLTFSEKAPLPLDRAHIKMVLNIGDEGLDWALRRLYNGGKIDGSTKSGYYELVPGATMPEDLRGRHPKSRGNLRQGRGRPANDDAVAA